MDKNKNLVIFHHTDLDGMGVKILGIVFGDALGFNPENVETYQCDYDYVDEVINNRLDKGVENIGYIIIGDISVQSIDLANRLDYHYQNNDFDLMLRDHHATATWLNDDYAWAQVKEVDDKEVPRCGTYWLYRSIYNTLNKYNIINDTVVQFVKLVDLYDTYSFRADENNIIWDADKLNAMFKTYGKEKFVEKMMERLRDDIGVFDKTDDLLYDIHVKKLESRVKSLKKDMFIGVMEE